ncbi:MAG TPA: RsmE family RNA methyltransferase [Pirellulales bacterium]|jgi:16S rRNA (uracil1498-N3)-methyltransferase
MSERFFISTPITGDRATLTGPEAHHLVNVMRAKIGDRVTLFDGEGDEFVAEISSVGRVTLDLKILERQSINREASVPLILAVALPKGDRQKFLLEKAVELGAVGLTPLVTERGVAQPVDSALERLRRVVVEASKQCGRNQLLEIYPAEPWKKFAAAAPANSSDTLRLIAHPGGKSLREIWQARSSSPNRPFVIAAIGPEGGFTDDEVAAGIAAGWTTVDLGPRILRVETATTAIAAWCALL